MPVGDVPAKSTMTIHLEHSSVMNFGVPLNSVATHCVLGGGMGKHLFKHVNGGVDVYNTQHGLTFAALCQLVEKGHSINHSAEGVGTQYCNFLKQKSIVNINDGDVDNQGVGEQHIIFSPNPVRRGSQALQALKMNEDIQNQQRQRKGPGVSNNNMHNNNIVEFRLNSFMFLLGIRY